MVKCKNCGAVYADELDRCPYCSTMNKRGAYRKFRLKVSDIIDSLLGLKEQVSASVGRIIFFSLIRGILIIAIISGLAVLGGMLTNINYYNDREYDEKTLKSIEWENENIEKLNEAFLAGDFDKVQQILNSNTYSSYRWEYYDAFYMRKSFQNALQADMTSVYDLEDVLYFLFYPDYFFNTYRMSDEYYAEYEEDRTKIFARCAEEGYSEDRLKEIYDACADKDGYLRYDALREFVKGGD